MYVVQKVWNIVIKVKVTMRVQILSVCVCVCVCVLLTKLVELVCSRSQVVFLDTK